MGRRTKPNRGQQQTAFWFRFWYHRTAGRLLIGSLSFVRCPLFSSDNVAVKDNGRLATDKGLIYEVS
jgi:hypothetical protein